jgi:hypothetical protein
MARTAKPKEETETQKEMKLEQELENLKKMVEDLIASRPIVASLNPVVTQKQEEENEIPFRKFIKVISLTNHTLTLSTEGHGVGTEYNFVEFGEIQNILYEDVAKIIHNNQKFTRNGAFMILDDRVIKLHNLTSYYEKFLDKDIITNILNFDADKIKEMFSKTTPRIQDAIVSLIVEKIHNGQDVDLNKVQILSDIYGKDIKKLA